MDLYPRSFSHPQGEIQYGIETDGEDVTAFVVQLRCRVGTGIDLVAQFDHTPEQGMGHDVEREDVRMDILRDGEKVDESDVAGAGLNTHPGPLASEIAGEYTSTCIEHENERLIERVLT